MGKRKFSWIGKLNPYRGARKVFRALAGIDEQKSIFSLVTGGGALVADIFRRREPAPPLKNFSELLGRWGLSPEEAPRVVRILILQIVLFGIIALSCLAALLFSTRLTTMLGAFVVLIFCILRSLYDAWRAWCLHHQRPVPLLDWLLMRN